MKITKIEFSKLSGTLTVWTDTFENMGFNFWIGEIADMEALKLKVKKRVQEQLDVESDQQTEEEKFKTLQSLEGTEI